MIRDKGVKTAKKLTDDIGNQFPNIVVPSFDIYRNEPYGIQSHPQFGSGRLNTGIEDLHQGYERGEEPGAALTKSVKRGNKHSCKRGKR